MRGDRLKEQRNRLNMSAEALAQIMGTTRVTVMRWENDTSEPDDDTKMKLASVLGVSISYLMGEDVSQSTSMETELQTEAAEDLDQIMKDLAAENPDIVIRFRNMRKSWPEMSREEKRIVLDGMMYVLGRADADVESRLRREGRKGNV